MRKFTIEIVFEKVGLSNMGYNGAKMVCEAHVCVIEIKYVSMKVIVRLSTILALLQPALKYKAQIVGLIIEEFKKSKNINCGLKWRK